LFSGYGIPGQASRGGEIQLVVLDAGIQWFKVQGSRFRVQRFRVNNET
jgi:hypothetical protein